MGKKKNLPDWFHAHRGRKFHIELHLCCCTTSDQVDRVLERRGPGRRLVAVRGQSRVLGVHCIEAELRGSEVEEIVVL